ncbi:hypothetical protein SPBR_02673 [Sporothrix brasiliensis 5110]|uniref:EGF domain-specific O-linked N-acetylglucosamine transferase n=1 Tax=Sporothrix brasiliensis 5110 TaxID=1398154 RepID=A0A0C2J887_9PEZI|nr:uncharacterized protein SPBR_02673 [Sporothrix brasiliensis 5110]KIH93207.1 hypothetical protein SPBR_02673 [Sporothrix brasiliensis 5110]
MLLQPGFRVRGTALVAIFAASLVLCLGYLYLSPSVLDDIQGHSAGPGLHPWPPSQLPPGVASASDPVTDLPLPGEYLVDTPASPFCDDRFNRKYLTDLRATAFQYCDASSRSSLTCFHSHTSSDEERDSLCVAQGVVFDAETQKFVLHCDVVEPDANATERGVISFHRVRQYWYDTGPKYIFDHHVRFVGAGDVAPLDGPPPPVQRHHYTLLVKREGEINPWHCLLEIWSAAMTMDVLRSTRDAADPAGRRPHVVFPDDKPNVLVVLLDDRLDGPYFDLWQLFSGRPPVRLHAIANDPQALAFYNTSSVVETQHHMVVPLAGGSNPLWQNDWAARECTRSDTLRVFVQRVLSHYGMDDGPAVVDPPTPHAPAPVRVTFIDRNDAGTRRLVDQDQLLEALRVKYNGTAVVAAVDFAAVPFAEQVRLARETDVLVGVHGAGLTHTMFLREHVTAVVEIQPADMDATFMGFRNLANMRGVTYFRTTAAPVVAPEAPAQPEELSAGETSDAAGGKGTRSLERRASWHRENFAIDSDAFVRAVGAAIESVYNKGLRHVEV